jgi:SAM-dependent methyltransferase
MSAVRHACCRVCGISTDLSILKATEMMFAQGGAFEYGQCSNCGSLSLLDIPTDLSVYYPTNYYSYTRTNHISRNGKLAAPLLRLLPDSILRITSARLFIAGQILQARSDVRGWLGLSSTSVRILDVGCGSGFGLMKYHYAGYRAEGCDPFYTGADPVEFPVHRAPLSGLNRQYDIITFNHSLEHVADPRADLLSAAKLLVAGGVCVIAIPKLPSAAFDHYGSNWFSLDAPRHLFIPSVDGLRFLASQVGLEVLTVTEEPVVDNHLWSEIYSRGHQYDGQSIRQLLTSVEIDAIRARAVQTMGHDSCCHATFVLRKAK